MDALSFVSGDLESLVGTVGGEVDAAWRTRRLVEQHQMIITHGIAPYDKSKRYRALGINQIGRP